MENSKLLQLLRTFSKREWKSFLDFVRSPYFNRNAEVVALCEWVVARAPRFEDLHRKNAYAMLFPGQPYDEAHLNHLMSFLLKCGERFVALQKMDKDDFATDCFLMQALAERNLEKHCRAVFENKRESLNRQFFRDAHYHLVSYLLENQEANRMSRSTVRKFNEHVQRAADSLDAFYLAEKLRCTCYMLTSQYVIATPYNLQLVDEVCRFVATHPLPPEAPAIQAYFCIFKMFTKDNAHDDFESLKALLAAHGARFSREETAELYQYAINYCNLQMMRVQERYVTEALDLYIKGVESGILLQNNRLSPWHFKNIIKLGLRLKKYDWTEQFILRNTPLLEAEFRDDALHYNLAELYYYTGRYDEAMLHLNKVEFTDVHYNLGAKVILSKIYYETGAADALESLLHAFSTYLHRSKVLSEDLRRTYLNFIRILWQIIRATPEKRGFLREKVENTPLLTEKNWLLRMTG